MIEGVCVCVCEREREKERKRERERDVKIFLKKIFLEFVLFCLKSNCFDIYD